MRVAVIGGKLQGVEATYLAHKAGWEVIVIDKDPMVPAKGLCDIFYLCDVTLEKELIERLKDVELIIPALEDESALSSLRRSARHEDIPLAHDANAYAISSSKIQSNHFFAHLGISAPLSWPDCGFPVIAKPSRDSGSKGVRRINSPKVFQTFADRPGSLEDWVIQEFLEGPSFSLEVLGSLGSYQTLQVTDLEMDGNYDCKRVMAPTFLRENQIKEFEQMALTLSRALRLQGIMDVEIILNDQTLKILEIDARLPSQTPTVVYLSTGINMVEMLGGLFVQNSKQGVVDISFQRGVVYEHIKVSPNRLEVSGEHIMVDAGPLHLSQDFVGADEAISNYFPGSEHWVATLMITGDDREEAWTKRCEVIEEIRELCSLDTYVDLSPAISSDSP